jgi:hypothetical protein
MSSCPRGYACSVSRVRAKRAWRDPTEAVTPKTDTRLDNVFFVIGGLAAVWLAYLLAANSFSFGWWQIVAAIVFWVLLAYLVLPRLHRILTAIYVPGYFIGRARTSDGLLGDPINLAAFGSESQVHEAMAAAGWTRADDLSLRTGLRIVQSTLLRRSYLEAPVSPLLLFGRQQDFAYQQEVDGSPGKRHHVRFWRCPEGWMLPGGIPVEWLAAGTYDRSVGLSLFTLQVTHKIDANTDGERDHIVATLEAADPRVAVSVIKDFSTGYHSRNGGGDEIRTDGNLPIVDLRKLPDAATAAAEPTDSRDRRPAPTVVGAVLVAARALAALLLALVTATDGRAVLTTDLGGTTSTTTIDVALVGVVGLLVLFALPELFIAWRVFLGRNWARLLAMTLSTLSILFQAIGEATGGGRITLQTTLPGLALDILLLLALSSGRARVYARRDRTRPPAPAS